MYEYFLIPLFSTYLGKPIPFDPAMTKEILASRVIIHFYRIITLLSIH